MATQACDRLIEKIDHCMIATHEDAKDVVEEMVVSHARDQRTVDGWRGFRTCLATGCEPRGMYLIIGWCELR